MESRLRSILLMTLSIVLLVFTPIIVSYGQSVAYFYDDLNRLIRIEYADGTIIEYTYDGVGNRLTEVITSEAVPAFDVYGLLGATVLMLGCGTYAMRRSRKGSRVRPQTSS